MPPLHDIAHLTHVELLTHEPEESRHFFVRYLGLAENGSEGDTAFLRTWDEYENTTDELTAPKRPGVGRTDLRASSPQAPQRLGAAIEATELGKGRRHGDPGYGPVHVVTDRDGHEMGGCHETGWYRPEENLEPALKSQAPAHPGRGASVRPIDHLAVDPLADRDFAVDVLGGMVSRQTVLDDGAAGSWTTPPPGWSSPPTGSRSTGTPRSGPRARPGDCRPCPPATPTAPPPVEPEREESPGDRRPEGKAW